MGQRLDSAVENRTSRGRREGETRLPWKKADARMDQSAERAEAMAKDLGESAKQAANTVMDKVDDATITAQVCWRATKDPI